MNKSIKHKKSKNFSKTLKNKKIDLNNKYANKELNYEKQCSAGLKPFELAFLKKKSSTSRQKEIDLFKTELIRLRSPKHISPQNDFYTYINYGWLKKVTLKEEQKYITQIDDFRLVQDKVYKDLNEITLDYIKSHNDKLSHELKNFYESVVNMNSVTTSNNIIKEIVVKIDEIRGDKNGLWKLLAYINENEIIPTGGCPFVWSMLPDDKSPHVYRSYINGPQLSILDTTVYYDDNTDVKYKAKMRKMFNIFVKKLFKKVFGDNHNFNTDDIYNIEVDIFNAYGCVDVTTKIENSYNRVFKDDAMKKYNFNWEEFSKELGFKETPSFFITSSLNYLKCGTDLLIKNWDTEKWRTYWIWLFIKVVARMTRAWETIIFDFYGEKDRGQEELNKSDAVSAALYMSIPFNTFFTNQYVGKYQNKEVIDVVNLLCNELRLVFINIIEKNTWMSPVTKKYAIKKLKKLAFVIGNPKELREDPHLDYENNNLYKNMEKIMLWRHKKFVELDGKLQVDIPKMDWTQYPVKMTGSQAYIVNASYTPSKNSIYINQGYIQKPFIDLGERGVEYNLAHIGFTIAHEMSHSLDDWGSQYDYNGNLYDWWTPEDKKKYKAIQDDVIKQYEEFAARDGIKFDASIGIGEDLADISGLSICNNYLWDFQEINTDIIPIKRVSFFMFYSYFAYQQRQKIGKKALSAQLKTNPHPLDKYRCNVPLSRSTIFTSLYDVKKGDGMWWHNHNVIW